MDNEPFLAKAVNFLVLLVKNGFANRVVVKFCLGMLLVLFKLQTLAMIK